MLALRLHHASGEIIASVVQHDPRSGVRDCIGYDVGAMTGADQSPHPKRFRSLLRFRWQDPRAPRWRAHVRRLCRDHQIEWTVIENGSANGYAWAYRRKVEASKVRSLLSDSTASPPRGTPEDVSKTDAPFRVINIRRL
jgi:hypothetical protein